MTQNDRNDRPPLRPLQPAGAPRGVRLDSRQPSLARCPLRWIRLAVALAVACGLTTPTITVGAQQQSKVFRVLSDATFLPFVNATLMSMPELGFVEGKNLIVERRTAEDSEQLAESARELVCPDSIWC